jgi:Tripartite tricarboxylate transporter family receptor
VPPLTEAGVAGFDFPIWYGIWAPAQTPAGIVSTLARDIADTLATAELSQWLTQHDADPMHMSPTGDLQRPRLSTYPGQPGGKGPTTSPLMANVAH